MNFVTFYEFFLKTVSPLSSYNQCCLVCKCQANIYYRTSTIKIYDFMFIYVFLHFEIIQLIFSYKFLPLSAVDFYNRINLIYGTIQDVCTNESCPVMSGGPK